VKSELEIIKDIKKLVEKKDTDIDELIETVKSFKLSEFKETVIIVALKEIYFKGIEIGYREGFENGYLDMDNI